MRPPVGQVRLGRVRQEKYDTPADREPEIAQCGDNEKLSDDSVMITRPASHQSPGLSFIFADPPTDRYHSQPAKRQRQYGPYCDFHNYMELGNY
ncbi:hypothetical protein Pmani_035500 [Petrolisthes manimaculis]|uniref:Uncharacterized protein n=1 Tax=Petrolisthes manimaculis TaxID=1843537 RepID=A0AAE1NLN5_9EUCA|nr:hypothetical protein Pmani_035500 [Petrolisthes manimaculis]